jgi:hypothetical protein
MYTRNSGLPRTSEMTNATTMYVSENEATGHNEGTFAFFL